MRRPILAVLSTLAASLAAGGLAAPAADAAQPAGYEALVPNRVLDTRSGLGHAGAVGAGETITLDVTGVAGVPDSGVGAVVVNVTATQVSDPTFVTVWPTGQPRPNASNLNPAPGVDTANLVIATVGTNGSISLYNSTGTTHLLADVTGWFPAGSSYEALTPARVLDTRSGVGAAAQPVAANGTINLDVTGVGGVPASGVGAVVVNVTATRVTDPTFVTVWPGGQAQPNASNINASPGDDASNLVVATVGANGTINLSSSAGTTDLLADVTGWFPTGADYHPLTPGRVLDSRSGVGTNGVVAAGATITVDVTGVAGVPADGVAAVVLNVTGTQVTGGTWATAWPTGEPRPDASILNLAAGQDTANLVIATVGDNGTISLYNSQATTHLLADVTGWFPTSMAGYIDGGRNHSCAIGDGGTVKCWGYNAFGQLGNGSTTDSLSPVTVTGISGAVAVTTGDYHSCALLDTGAVRCWGYNEGGQLGNGGAVQSTTPVAVTGLSGVTAITAGSYHTCALLGTGGASCWGFNGFGQLGNTSTADSSVPVSVSGLSGATALSAGGYHTCGVKSDGTVACWGANESGQVGGGPATHSTAPVAVPSVTGATAVAAGGYHTCALGTGGSAWCWGANVSGQLGNGSTGPTGTPTAVGGVTGATAIATGEFHTCVVGGGSGWCWGENGDGQLGNGTTTPSPTPVAVSGLTMASDVAAGINHTCAALTNGSYRCWGVNGTGELGDGTTTNRSTPVPVAGY